MTITHVETGYLETPYLDSGYLATDVNGYMGQQAQFVIAAAKPMGMQCNIVVSNFPRSLGQQATVVVGASKSLGMQYEQTNIVHEDCGAYLEDGYLEGEYLSHGVCAHGGQQANFITTQIPAYGMQAQFHINDYPAAKGQQAKLQIDRAKAYGMQATFQSTQTPAYGMQALFSIANRLRATGQQAKFAISKTSAYGMQAEIIQQLALGMQATISLYNTNRLRILCDFPSRGLSSATGSNSWGFPAGQGQSWKSNSTEAGDFSPFNLNTDIVEETWRSNAPTVTGINLSCDTERTQGVFLDTFAILNHNITTSATVTLVGSSSPTFSTIGISIPLEPREDDPNIYYIAPTLPNVGYRYWRISIDDATNPDGFVSIGTVIFGAARIFFGECFVDQVEFQLKDYTSSVHTEAFTNVNNARAQRKILKLDFRSLSYLKSNFRLMRSMFRNERTVLKCLWLPTPSPLNQEYTARFAMFAKLTQIPNESHNHKGGDADYVTFTIDLDESN